MASRAVLRKHVLPHGPGKEFAAETGFYVASEQGPDTVLAPDVAFVRSERLPPPEELVGFPRVAPDLAVEVVSPSDRKDEVDAKVTAYLDAEVRFVLLVQPRPWRESPARTRRPRFEDGRDRTAHGRPSGRASGASAHARGDGAGAVQGLGLAGVDLEIVDDALVHLLRL